MQMVSDLRAAAGRAVDSMAATLTRASVVFADDPA